MPQILFVCTGNYYRSRHAEIYFNWLAQHAECGWTAFSRGLGLLPANNVGPLSRHTIARLKTLSIPLPDPLAFPEDLSVADLSLADRIIALKEAEHRPLMIRRFPEWVERVEYWGVHDLDCTGPEVTLPHIELLVTHLAREIGMTSPRTAAGETA